MTDEKPTFAPFSDADSLLLQQLLTRQSIAARVAQRRGAASDEADEADEADVPAPRTADQAVPVRWRLIPEAVTLHPWQQECLQRWLPRGKGTVKVATGGGKTVFALAAAQALQNGREPDLRLVIVVPTVPLLNQWREELAGSNLPASAIGLMGGGEREEAGPDLRVLLCVINSARDRLPAFVEKLGWSSRLLLVVDECHRANATEARNIFRASPKYTLGLSATPETDQADDSVPSDEAYASSPVGQGLGPIFFDFSLKQSLEAGLLTPFEVWHVGVPLLGAESSQHAKLSREISELRRDLQAAHRRGKTSLSFIPWCQSQASRGGADAARFIGLANERKRLVYRSAARAELTSRILEAAMLEPQRKAIVFHEAIEEIDRLFLEALQRGVPAVLEHSKLPSALRAANIDAFRRGIARCIISAKSLVEGFNVPSADLGVIAASSGSVRQRIQSLGRMLRRKEGGSGAVIFVLYVRDTEDESIYQKADWEAVVGAERNRYFRWDPPEGASTAATDLETLRASLVELKVPPRKYLPPCSELDAEDLVIGGPYPAQSTGIELKVDQSGNLRTMDEALVPADPALVKRVLELSKFRRAVVTGCGHLIVRTGEGAGHEAVWTYLGALVVPLADEAPTSVTKLGVKSQSGRRQLVLKHRSGESYARSPEKATSVDAGRTQVALLAWIRRVEETKHVTVKELRWDGATRYWLELGGETIMFTEDAAPLEFPS